MDVLEAALERFHFSSTVYCKYCTNRSPWGIGLDASRTVHFHAVRSGRAWVRAYGRETVELEAGDFVLVPQGDAHEIVDPLDTKAIPAREVFAGPSDRWTISLGGNGPPSELICAGFACVAGSANPLLSLLPRIIHLRIAETSSLEPILRLAEHEMRSPGSATSAILARLAELLMIESIRAYVNTLQPGQGGWLGALQDPQIATVIGAIHEHPARHWTLADLAARASMSRTSLATRFRAVVGMPVQAYIARFKMITAASLLEDPDRPKLARVAGEVGYASEAAFSRAFIREMGIAPTKVRPVQRQASG